MQRANRPRIPLGGLFLHRLGSNAAAAGQLAGQTVAAGVVVSATENGTHFGREKSKNRVGRGETNGVRGALGSVSEKTTRAHAHERRAVNGSLSSIPPGVESKKERKREKKNAAYLKWPPGEQSCAQATRTEQTASGTSISDVPRHTGENCGRRTAIESQRWKSAPARSSAASSAGVTSPRVHSFCIGLSLGAHCRSWRPRSRVPSKRRRCPHQETRL